MRYVIHQLPQWIENVPIEDYMDCARRRPPGLFKDWRFHPLLEDMRALVPVPGDEWVKDIDVLVAPGQGDHQGQVQHAHDEWTAIFYVQPAGVPIVLKDENEVVRITPDPGDVIVLAPFVEHGVAPNNSDQFRLSFAMLVEDPDIPSKFAHYRKTV